MIGSVLAAQLTAMGHEVIPFDIVNSDQHDLRRPSFDFDSAMNDADFVMFLAFDVGGARYLKHHDSDCQFIANNMRIMQVVFDRLEHYRRPFIFASSHMAEHPATSYGALKRVGECFTRALGGITARLWNVYGSEPIGERSHVIPDFIHAAGTSRRIEMLTTGEEMKQFVHVNDCADALIRLSERYDEWRKTEPACVASGHWVSILEIARIVARSAGGDVVVIPGTKVEPSVMVEPAANLKAFWQPRIPLAKGIELMM